VLDPFDLGKHLLQRDRDEVFYFNCTGTRKRHENIRKRHIDLRFFLTRRNSDGEDAQQETGQCK